jgi:acetylglutamate kinase
VTSAAEKAQILAEALPYIRRFFGKTVVVKYGGNALAGAASEQDGLAQFAADVVLMHSVGMRPVVVHGGGPQIGDLLKRIGKESEFVDGLRVTDAETLDVVRMVLVGKVNREIVAAINVHGPLAVGMSGEDGSLLTATQLRPELGFVGEVTDVRVEIVSRLMGEELIPVIATIGVDVDGQAYNINADTAAAAIAAALDAEKLVYLTDIEGIRRDVTDAASLLSQVTVAQIDDLIADGTISGGMIPKVEACVAAVKAGVGVAHILDGRVPRALLLEIFTPEGIGTMVTAS